MAIHKCNLQKRFDDDGKPLCTYEAPKAWKGRCPGCGRLCGFWKVGPDVKAKSELASAAASTEASAIIDYIPTGIDNYDGVTGGGLVKGQLVQFVGPSGSGKSRLAMQICQSMAARIEQPFLFASAEETIADVTKMCRSVGATSDRIKIIGTEGFDIDYVLQTCDQIKPALLILDSLQAADGWSMQHSETATLLKEYCDRTGQIAIVMNHTAKDLSAKGGTTVGHMFKATIYMYEYDPAQDGKVKATFGSRFFRQFKNGEVRLIDIRTLMSGKNRSGGSGLKEFFIFDSDGKLLPLKKKSPVIATSNEPDDDDDDEDEEPKLLSRA